MKTVIPFQPHTAFSVAGPSGVGKSTWTLRLLKNKDSMFKPDPPPGNILYCYMSEQDSLNEAERTIPNFYLHRGLPTAEQIDSLGPNPIVVLDDMMDQVMASRDSATWFSRDVHHKGYTLLLIVQNLYEQGRSARTIALNCNYLILFKHVRDKTQLVTLGKQMHPGQSHKIIEALDDITKEDPRGYLVLDNTCTGDDKTRMRTRIFPGEDPVVYI